MTASDPVTPEDRVKGLMQNLADSVDAAKAERDRVVAERSADPVTPAGPVVPTEALDAIDSVVENVDVETAIVEALHKAGYSIVPAGRCSHLEAALQQAREALEDARFYAAFYKSTHDGQAAVEAGKSLARIDAALHPGEPR